MALLVGHDDAKLRGICDIVRRLAELVDPHGSCWFSSTFYGRCYHPRWMHPNGVVEFERTEPQYHAVAVHRAPWGEPDDVLQSLIAQGVSLSEFGAALSAD